MSQANLKGSGPSGINFDTDKCQEPQCPDCPVSVSIKTFLRVDLTFYVCGNTQSVFFSATLSEHEQVKSLSVCSCVFLFN